MNVMRGRRCIITGASRGLGAAVAKKLWLDGADLLLVARSEAALVDLRNALGCRDGQQVHILACDLAASDGPRRIAAEAKRFFGSISVLVNNAAVQGPIGLAWENDWEEWERTIRVNLLAPVELTRYCVPLLSVTGGKIISISGGGATGPRPRFTAYGTAKAGLVRFCETFSQEVAALGIDVNCVAPGAMSTAMTGTILAAGAESAGAKEYKDAMRVQLQPSKLMERAASLCAFLASSASDGMTGKLLSAQWDPWETLPEYLSELRSTDIYTLRRIVPADRGLSWGEK